MKRLIVLLALFLSLSASGQEDGFRITKESYGDTSVEMADTMRSNGKIYVVVTVIMVLFTGIVAYTVTIDRKLKKIEREVFKEKS